MTEEQNKLQDALYAITEVYRHYDLAGSFIICDANGYQIAYIWDASWNALIPDPTLPPVGPRGEICLGFRLRIKSSEIGQEEAQKLANRTFNFLATMRDFGKQLDSWMADLMQMMRKSGIKINYQPFQGKKLPRIGGLPK